MQGDPNQASSDNNQGICFIADGIVIDALLSSHLSNDLSVQVLNWQPKMGLLLIGIGAALIALILILVGKMGSRPRNFPPGPPTFPIIGNIHQMPKKNGHIQLQKWAQKYGFYQSIICQ
jgi:hypothetical protein